MGRRHTAASVYVSRGVQIFGMSKLSARGKARSITERETGFSISSAPAPLPTYDALRDVNLRQHFESRGVQRFLQQKGWVDKTGKIIDLDKYRLVVLFLFPQSKCRYARDACN